VPPRQGDLVPAGAPGVAGLRLAAATYLAAPRSHLPGGQAGEEPGHPADGAPPAAEDAVPEDEAGRDGRQENAKEEPGGIVRVAVEGEELGDEAEAEKEDRHEGEVPQRAGIGAFRPDAGSHVVAPSRGTDGAPEAAEEGKEENENHEPEDPEAESGEVGVEERTVDGRSLDAVASPAGGDEVEKDPQGRRLDEGREEAPPRQARGIPPAAGFEPRGRRLLLSGRGRRGRLRLHAGPDKCTGCR
jgi:hypothetical protein